MTPPSHTTFQNHDSQSEEVSDRSLRRKFIPRFAQVPAPDKRYSTLTMRVTFLVLLAATTLIASTNGLSIADNSVQVNNAAANSNPAITSKEGTGRYLKGSNKAIGEDEERGMSNLAKLKAFFQKLPDKIGAKYLELVMKYRAKHPEFNII